MNEVTCSHDSVFFFFILFHLLLSPASAQVQVLSWGRGVGAMKNSDHQANCN